ncbi:hypothetical protein MmiHf6_13440 [Methanimicrococcus hongohii]|uniref:Uncharacterized protein n=1 Tax=Methanimicrococcus hongohii TaxID=3028295 RepID=A0AA96ZSZ7_9EURY|nr:hypothetical protein [Methanimicrococcus sp. Hf6]WNY24019.1 hypothetical protein MmiHf6_13440 [Methanimicrococcus sp. Hf6]
MNSKYETNSEEWIKVNYVAESSGTYTIEKKQKFQNIQCLLIKKPTNRELVALGDYQDVHPWNTQKLDWSFEIPEDRKQKAWCYVINSCCRFRKFYKSMTREEQKLVNSQNRHLDKLIKKGRILGSPTIYRGVFDVNWLPENHGEGTIYTDDAYGSFSLELENAYQYVNPEKPILFQLILELEMEAY